ncbi:hypothetical protein K505DRAFT_323864 [Melanomma pulvis-pyrius CBS 109.77]|uniref:Structure-specific endonuclease subunit SLX4 n=1 Tax=Melanomma pulvis-pyrius CBS 109.77 TaxID=1314802 RepID=A0A6A6XH76_9PLEO|nr:hypothetical protein K505DRAFT_323864 [Melanomma pulvis-pyrius CBS 109.77]
MAGTTFDLVLLSSSPPPSSAVTLTSPPSNQQRVRMATYSPVEPSPPASPKNHTLGALKSGSRAVPVPEGATRGFATAGSLVKSHHFNAQLDDKLQGVLQAQSRRNSLQDIDAPKKLRKRATKVAPAGDVAEPKVKKPRARKSRAGKDEHMHDAASRDPAPAISSHFAQAPEIKPSNEPAAPVMKTKSTKPRKPRAKEKSENGETQTKITKAKITKPRGTTKSTGKPPRKTTGVASSHFVNNKDTADVTPTNWTKEDVGTHCDRDEGSSIWDVPSSPRRKKDAHPKQKPPEQTLDLDEAVSRRRDWTPPKDTSIQDVFTDSTGKENNSAILHEEGGSFTNLLSNFAYTNLNTLSATISESAGITKKRRVELVDVPVNQGALRHASPEKGKAPKKKPRTITDFVTDQYAHPKDVIPKSSVKGQFFGSHSASTATKVPLNDMSVSVASKSVPKPPRRRSTSKSTSEKGGAKPKSKKPTTKTAKSRVVEEKLLSPASAVLRMNKQDILFGTSSQLALEESPTLIRHIQQAIQKSEEDADVLPGIGLAGTIGPPRWPRLGKVEGKRGLWVASARGEGGQLLEKLYDVYIPEPDRTQDLPLLMDSSYNDHDTSFTDIDNFHPPPIQISSDLLGTPQVPLKDGNKCFRDEVVNDVSFDNIDDYAQAPPPSNQKAESSFFDIDDFSTQTPITSYNASPATLFTESTFLDIDDFPTQSSNPLPAASISKGSPKKRGRPPKSHSTIQAQSKPKFTATKKAPSKGKRSFPTRPSTPPRTKGRFADIEEILDSEDDEALSPTPPRTSRLLDSALPLAPSMPSLEPPLTSDSPEIVPVFQVPLSMLEWAGAKSSVFAQITTTIRALPPTTNPTNPSWHEKILLYDAIVLEEFTAFLNKHTRIRAYRRATLKQVKAWNKTLKKEGREVLGEVDKDDESKINVVEKELETWMVQGWCQEMSVCCISKVRSGRSGMGKGSY